MEDQKIVGAKNGRCTCVIDYTANAKITSGKTAKGLR